MAAQSAVLVPAPEAEPAVSHHRARLDRAAAWGVPAHVTILYPFVAPSAITAATMAAQDPVPHLTVGDRPARGAAALRAAETELVRELPITMRVRLAPVAESVIRVDGIISGPSAFTIVTGG
jgi:hypothetical protein